MNSQEPGLRKAKTLELDAKILAASVTVICSSGPDFLNFAEISRLCNATTGAMYSRYENVEELLVDVWVRKAGPALKQIFELTSRAYRGDREAAEVATQKLEDDRLLLTCAYSLLLVSPRVDELAEVIPQDLKNWLEEMDWQDSILAVAFVLGAIGFDSILDAPRANWGLRLKWASQIGAAQPNAGEQTPIESPDSLESIIQPNTGSDVRDRLMVQMSLVVARSGLRRATTSRVSRGAGYPQSTFFGVWHTRADFVRDWAPVVLKSLMRASSPDGTSAALGDLDAAVRGVSQILGPGFKMIRRLRVELLLASVSDQEIASAVKESDSQTLELVGPPSEEGRQLLEGMRAVVLGLVILKDATGVLDRFDLATPIKALLQSARERT